MLEVGEGGFLLLICMATHLNAREILLIWAAHWCEYTLHIQFGCTREKKQTNKQGWGEPEFGSQHLYGAAYNLLNFSSTGSVILRGHVHIPTHYR